MSIGAKYFSYFFEYNSLCGNMHFVDILILVPVNVHLSTRLFPIF